MKHNFLCFIFITLFISISHAANWEWAVSSGAGGMDRVWDIALDYQGNILVTGEFTDTLQIGSVVVNGWGLNDIFVAKYSPDGIPIWAKAFGGSEGDIGLSIDTDSQGNSYITGYYGGTAHFEEQNLTSVGSWDIFVLKLDSDGNMLRVFSEGGISNDIGYGLAVTQDGKCFVTGWFGDTITFHDNSSLTSYGGSDILVYAYDVNGDIIWKHKAGSADVEYGYKIDVDAQSSCYVTGTAGQNSNFDGLFPPGNGAFIAKYDISGNIIWVNSGSGAGVNSIAVDHSSSIIEQYGCITGRITGNATFGDFVLTSIDGSDDGYGAVFDLLTGNWNNAVSGGGSGSDKGRACTYNNHPYYTGSFEGTASLFSISVTASGMSDGYVYSAASIGNDWLLHAGGANNDTPTDIAVDDNGNVFICGWYSGIARFGASILIDSGSDSDLDMFIAKINTHTSADDNLSPVANQQLSCYPNPFVGNIHIEYQNKHTVKNSLPGFSVYNVRGQFVKRLPAIDSTPGMWTSGWDGTDKDGAKCPSGVYFIKSIDKLAKSQKVLLLK